MQLNISAIVFWIFLLSAIGMLIAEYEVFEPQDEDAGDDDDGTL